MFATESNSLFQSRARKHTALTAPVVRWETTDGRFAGVRRSVRTYLPRSAARTGRPTATCARSECTRAKTRKTREYSTPENAVSRTRYF